MIFIVFYNLQIEGFVYIGKNVFFLSMQQKCVQEYILCI